jgi:hypothetical protein
MFGNIHEQEEREFEMGRYQNESQAAFAVSRAEFSIAQSERSNGRHQLEVLVAEGKHVVFSSSTAFCPRTDAILGDIIHVVAVFDTREEADADYQARNPEETCDSDFMIGVRSPKVAVVETPTQTEDPDGPDYCPF